MGGAETFYTHAKWPKPRVLSRLKGLLVNAVAWNRQQITEGYALVLYVRSFCFLFVNSFFHMDIGFCSVFP